MELGVGWGAWLASGSQGGGCLLELGKEEEGGHLSTVSLYVP